MTSKRSEKRLPATGRVRDLTPAPEPVPTGLLVRLGRFAARHRYSVLVATAILAILAGILGAGASERMGSGGLVDPSAPSARAEQILVERFDAGTPQLIVLAESTATVDEPDAVAAGTALTERVKAHTGVRGVESYWAGGNPALRSTDSAVGLLLIRLHGDEDEAEKSAADIVEQLGDSHDGLRLRFTGPAALDRAVDEQAETDLTRAELLTAPLTLLILVIVFGSVVAAGFPLLVGFLAVVGALGALWAISAVTDLSVFSVNLTTALGLGLAIDYSLFLVSRYREQLRAGRRVEDAIAVAMHTAGRTVLFSALTVALALSALLVFPGYFLRSFAYAGIAVSLLAAAATLIVLPALFAVAGHRIDRFALRRTTAVARPSSSRPTGAWYRLATAVMRHPVLIAVATTAALAVLALPFARVEFGLIDHRVLPAASEGHQAAEQLRTRFDARETTATPVVLNGSVDDRSIEQYAAGLSQLPHVIRVDSAVGSHVDGDLVAPPGEPQRFRAPDGSEWVSVVADVEPNSTAGTQLVEDIRDEPTPAPALVGGTAATLIDTRDAIAERLPWAVMIVIVSTTVLLFALTGSIIIPLKALLLSAVSLTATFGAMVVIFQDGHLQWLVGDFTVTGWLDVTAPVLMFCVAFGLAMDYEVLLIARIKEEYDRTGDNTTAVATGLERTGRLITAAAVLIAVVLGALATSGITYLKMLGVGLALAVLVDAFVVRALLVPALMRLAGPLNWWAPAALRRLHDRRGVRH